ncbi:MAG TPA: VOC family protein [Ilumatobacteraceae bacterium]|nr:VOC family protein [Ilumatobacteraceae bacterium]
MTLGVPRVDEARQFYREFGLTELTPGDFASRDGGEQLHVVERPIRQLVEVTLAADDPDDLERIAGAAAANDLAVTNHEDHSISVVEPVVGIRVRAAIRDRITQSPNDTPPMNGPGNTVRDGDRAPAIFAEGPAAPRRLGHVLWGTPDIAASKRFLVDVLGFRLSDESAGIIAFLRCSPDHHNVGLISSPVPFFHHSSWQVDDVDEIGRGAHHLLTGDPLRSVWGLGRHFLGSNLFWYFRDPAGNFAEYFADLDQIGDDDAWIARDWPPDKSLYAWGPPVPRDFVEPPDLAEIKEALSA